MDNRHKFNIFADTVKVNLDTGKCVEPKICIEDEHGNGSKDYSTIKEAMDTIVTLELHGDKLCTDPEVLRPWKPGSLVDKMAFENIRIIETPKPWIPIEIPKHTCGRVEAMMEFNKVNDLKTLKSADYIDFRGDAVEPIWVHNIEEVKEELDKYVILDIMFELQTKGKINPLEITKYESTDYISEFTLKRVQEIWENRSPTAGQYVELDKPIVIHIYNGVCSECGSPGDQLFTSFCCTKLGCKNFKE